MCSLCWKLCHRQCNGGKDQDGSPRVVQRSVLPQKLFHRWDNKTSQILHAFPQASGSGHSDLKRVSSDLLLFYAFHMPDAEEMEFESGWAPKPRTLDSSMWCCAPEQASLNVRTWDLKASSARHFVRTSPWLCHLIMPIQRPFLLPTIQPYFLTWPIGSTTERTKRTQ